MMGWGVTVFRQTNTGDAPATFDSAKGVRLAVWQADVSGLKWIDQLKEEGHVISLGGNGYPLRYTGLAGKLLPTILEGPPLARDRWVCDPVDVVGAGWVGGTLIEKVAIAECRPDEWLLIEAWDQS